jgi:hypothetical protein
VSSRQTQPPSLPTQSESTSVCFVRP